MVCHEFKGGGFDKLLLDSLYEDDAARRQIHMQQAGYNTHGYGMTTNAHNPFEQQGDPFAMSNSIAPPTNVQMAMLQQQQMVLQQQQQQQQNNVMMVPFQSQFPQQQQQTQPYMGSSNPFGDPYSFSANNTQGHNNPLI